jgi:hypothetical protein
MACRAIATGPETTGTGGRRSLRARAPRLGPIAGTMQGGSEMDFVKSRLSVIALAALLGVSGVSTAGCKKDEKKDESSSKSDKDKKKADDDKADDDGDKAGKKKKAKKGDDDDDDKGGKKANKAAGKGGKYAAGEVLKHVPKTCPQGQAYIDLAELQKNDAFASNVDAFQEKITASMKDKDLEKGGAFLKSLKKSGIDPTKDLKEIAFCGAEKKDFVLAIGGNFDGKEPLDALVKATKDSDDEDKLEKKSKDGTDYLKAKKGFIVQVTPNVLVIADDLETAIELKKESDSSSGWDIGTGKILSFDFDEHGDKFGIDITSKDETLEMKVVVDSKKAPPKQKDLETVAKTAGGNLAKGPFSSIADDIKSTKITVDGNKVTVVFTASNEHVSTLMKTLTTTDPKEIEAALKKAVR